ncbi:hypothetical protein GGR56DRAFT_637793 [Xylariaceae sp. FL0804]|nr:hypothetical protein GGR56DRAFT_637793 [Xylariaceae sp. FL0804]
MQHALVLAVELVHQKSSSPPSARHRDIVVHIFSDCSGPMRLIRNFLGLTAGTTVTRRDKSKVLGDPPLAKLLGALNAAMEAGLRVQFNWVPGHAATPGNKRADRLAREAYGLGKHIALTSDIEAVGSYKVFPLGELKLQPVCPQEPGSQVMPCLEPDSQVVRRPEPDSQVVRRIDGLIADLDRVRDEMDKIRTEARELRAVEKRPTEVHVREVEAPDSLPTTLEVPQAEEGPQMPESAEILGDTGVLGNPETEADMLVKEEPARVIELQQTPPEQAAAQAHIAEGPPPSPDPEGAAVEIGGAQATSTSQVSRGKRIGRRWKSLKTRVKVVVQGGSLRRRDGAVYGL